MKRAFVLFAFVVGACLMTAGIVAGVAAMIAWGYEPFWTLGGPWSMFVNVFLVATATACGGITMLWLIDAALDWLAKRGYSPW